jgi:hypothetical protein
LIETLLASHEPSVRWKVLVRVLGEDQSSSRITAIQQEVRSSPRVRALLSGRDADGRLNRGANVYAKWQGAHWVLTTLADLGYPSGDALLAPIGDQVLEFWLQDGFFSEFEADTKARAYRQRGVPVMRGRHRRCASQQGNALYFSTQLGIGQEYAERLVERLLHWQWPDGGWNCLTGLKALAEVGLIQDPRCSDALDLLERKELPGGGWPAERRFYNKVTSQVELHADYVDWGGASRTRMNEWVTADALYVLRGAGRL